MRRKEKALTVQARLTLGSGLLTSREPKPALLRKMAAAVILADRSAFDYRQIVAEGAGKDCETVREI
jgi:hypothetical protein